MGDCENFEKRGVVYETPRLVLRAVRDSDLPELHRKLFGAPDVMRHVFNGSAFSYAEAVAFVREHFNNSSGNKTGLSVVVEKVSNQIVGFAGLKLCTALEANDFEIGFVLARDAWGKGYASEIGQAQLALGFQDLRCRRLLALVSPENAPSIRTIERLGMAYVSDCVVEGRGPRRVYCIHAEHWRDRAPLNNGHG